MSQAVLSRTISAPIRSDVDAPDYGDSMVDPPSHFVDAPPLPLTEARSRNEAIDILRLFAALSIVLVHAIESPQLESFGNFWRFPVPFYLFASLYFQAASQRKNSDRPLVAYAQKRFVRLYVPFLVWSAIYLVARNFKDILIHNPLVILTPSLLWKGTDYHLWFLPFLLVFSMTLAVTQSIVLRAAPRLRWPLIGAFVAAGIWFALTPLSPNWDLTFGPIPKFHGDNPTYAYVQWWRALPAACGAMAFALFLVGGDRKYRIAKPLALAGLTMAIGCCFLQWFHGPQMIARAMAGLGCILMTLAPWDTTGPLRAGLARVGRLGYGIYLNHVLCVEVIHLVNHKLHLPVSPLLDLATFSVSTVASIFIAWRISKVAKLAWLNG